MNAFVGIYVEIHFETILRRGVEGRWGIAVNFDRSYDSVRVRECGMPRMVQKSFCKTEGSLRCGRGVSAIKAAQTFTSCLLFKLKQIEYFIGKKNSMFYSMIFIWEKNFQSTGVRARGAVLYDREIRHAKRVELLSRAGKLHRGSGGEESTFIGIRVLPNSVDFTIVSIQLN